MVMWIGRRELGEVVSVLETESAGFILPGEGAAGVTYDIQVSGLKPWVAVKFPEKYLACSGRLVNADFSLLQL